MLQGTIWSLKRSEINFSVIAHIFFDFLWMRILYLHIYLFLFILFLCWGSNMAYNDGQERGVHSGLLLLQMFFLFWSAIKN